MQKEAPMPYTTIFMNGGLQAVQIPAELAYARTDFEMEIERFGDEIRIRPTRKPLAGLMERFARFSPEFMAEGRGENTQCDRGLF